VLFSTGTVIGMYIFSMWLRIPDSVFAMCVFVTSCAEKIIFSLAPKDWYLYIGKCKFISVRKKMRLVPNFVRGWEVMFTFGGTELFLP